MGTEKKGPDAAEWDEYLAFEEEALRKAIEKKNRQMKINNTLLSDLPKQQAIY